MNNIISPIFVIGSARNGTTNLTNSIASFPQVVGAEHWLHYGNHESNLYRNKKYWGDLTNTDDYINFLYQYASSDYFSLCRGDIEYHLNHQVDNFYTFFFDLMDNYARLEGKTFWITKLDQHFFFDDKERELFFRMLNKRYINIKCIRIKRNFKDAFKSYINMEGEFYRMRQRPTLTFPALVLQASRYVLTYHSRVKELDGSTFEIPFEDYIASRQKYITEISAYLNISIGNSTKLPNNRYQVNTSFVSKSKKELPGYIISLIPFFLSIYKSYPFLASLVWKKYFQTQKNSNPIFHRILNYKYFREQLMRELSLNNSNGVLERIKDEEFTINL